MRSVRLAAVVWTNEEGVAFNNGLFGSRAAAGLLTAGEMDHVWNGISQRDALKKIGGDADRIATAQRAAGSFKAYFELHIEQGGNLDREGIPVGVVEGIVAIDRYDVEIRGFANHAGTTPMPDRQDALLAASMLTVAVNRTVRRDPGRQVGTVGHIEVTPNASERGARAGAADGGARCQTMSSRENRQTGRGDSRTGALDCGGDEDQHRVSPGVPS